MEPTLRAVVRALSDSPPEGIDAIALEPMAPPDVSKLGPDDVLVRVESAQVGWVDLLMTSGQYQHVPALPYCPGIEYAGTVAWSGDGALAVGERVLVDGFRSGPRSSGAHQAYGGFAGYAVAPRDAVLRIPATLSFDEAACLLGNFETAYYSLFTRGRLAKGEVALIHGASGATGLAAVQLAKRAGAVVIATGRSERKLERVRAAGADHTIVVGEGVDLKAELHARTGGRGADVIYDGVGGEITAQSLRAAAFGARVLIVGWAATPAVAKGKGGRGSANANQIPTNLILMKNLDVLGCPTVISSVRDPSLRPPRLATIMGWASLGELRPVVSSVYPLRELQAAMRAKWRGEPVGGCVVRPWVG